MAAEIVPPTVGELSVRVGPDVSPLVTNSPHAIRKKRKAAHHHRVACPSRDAMMIASIERIGRQGGVDGRRANER
jgi:hypothetical protein